MFEYLKERTIDGLKIKSVKETNTKYTIVFEYEGDEAKADLPKSCTPSCHYDVCDNAVITAMSTIYFNRGNFVKAKEWLDKIINK